ncbi:MAG: polymerase [Desulfococcus sp. 4484_241]|nr:MAG: polymerase [Desulfococcus sp. 4484_241]
MLPASRILFLFLLAFSPLAFGSVEPWAFFIMVLLCGLSICLYLTHCLKHGQPLRRVPCIMPLSLIGIYVAIQMIPLPETVLGLISPATATVRHHTAGILFPGNPWPITLDIHGTMFELVRWLVWAGVYWLTIQLLTDRTMLRRTLLFLALFGGVFALSSILQYILTEDRALWFRWVPDNAMVFGSYVCHNHYAGLMEMIFGPVLALVFVYRPPRQFGTMREKVLGLFQEEETPLFMLLFTGAVIMVLSVFFSLSRGGILCILLETFFLIPALPGGSLSKRRVSRKTSAWLFLCALLMAVTWFGWERLDARFGELPKNLLAAYGRPRFWQDSLRAASDFPLTGAGFGAFGDIIPAYQQVFFMRILDHAHNDYIELLVEGGAIGVLLFAAFFICFFKNMANTLKKRRDKQAVVVCLGAVAGITAILCHSLIDFNLHIPANALYLAFLCGLAVATANTRFNRYIPPRTYLETVGPNGTKLGLALWLLLWLPCLGLSMGQWAASLYADPLLKARTDAQTPPAASEETFRSAMRAAALSPLNPDYRELAGDTALLSGKVQKAADAYGKALFLSPTRSETLQKAGNAVFQATRNVKRADALMAAGIKMYPTRPGAYGYFADFLFKTGRKKEALSVVRDGLSAAPSYADIFFGLMRYAGITPAEMYSILPGDSAVLAKFASYVRNTGYDFMREKILLKAVEAASHEPDPGPGPYTALAWLYIGQKNYDKAITLLERAMAKMPDRPELLYLMGRTYERSHINYKAVEFYKKLQIIAPGYRDTARRLEALAEGQNR